MKNVVAYYITPHGFGHAVRSLEIIREMYRLAPHLNVVVVSTIPEWLIPLNVGRSLPLRPVTLDIGLVQHDNVRIDLEGTREVLARMKANENAVVQEEVRFLKEENVKGIVSDVAFIPFISAQACGIPSVGVGNFTWDWIYAAYCRDDGKWEEIVSWIKRAYSMCGLFLQLPMPGECSACPVVKSVPLVARQSSADPQEIRKALSFSEERKHFLLVFTDLKLEEPALKRIEAIRWASFVYRKPLKLELSNSICVTDPHMLYQDVLAACDGVITKPGYGIVSDCLAHGTPTLYTDRGPFPEYEFLVRELESHLPALHIPSLELLEGRWEKHLEKLAAMPRKHTSISAHGASVCARMILDHIGV